MTDETSLPGTFNPSQPHIAGVYDHLLGGKDNFAADRALGDRIIASLPAVQLGVQAQRAVLGRVVRYLVGEAGLTQLVDIGAGLPTADNVHEIAGRVSPLTRVAYIDNDPVVLAHARALLADNATTIALAGDLRDPDSILHDPGLRRHLDWNLPVGLLLCGILHYILDDEDPVALLGAFYRALPPGSYVFIHHLLESGDRSTAEVQAAFQSGLGRGQFRDWDQIRALFRDLDLVEPGLVLVPDWRPEPGAASAADHPVLRLAAAGVGRKP